MFQVKNYVAAACVALAFAVAAPVAMAQEVLVVNAQRVLRDSQAGQDMYQKLQQIGETMQSEMAPEQQALQTELTSLETRTQGMTTEQIQADPALVQQLQAYQRKLQTNAQKADRRSRELAQTERNALASFSDAMESAVETVRARRNGQIVLVDANVYSVTAEADITNEVITQLNSTTPTIAVTRVTLPANTAGTPQ